MEGQSLNTEMIHAFPDMDDRMTTSAYEQQKVKLTPELFMHLLHDYNNTPYRHNLYNDKYELYAVDGSDFNMPYQSKSKYACKAPTGRPRNDGEPVKPFSQLHGNILFNITDRTYQDIVIQPKSQANERGAAIDMFDHLNPKHPYIVLMDRGYDGFNMIEHGNRLNSDGYYVIRTKAGNGGIREIANLPDKECDVVVSRTINAVSVPQSEKKKYKYVLPFKDTVTLVRKYFRLHAHEPSDRIYVELLGYTRPVVSGRADKRNMKPKTAIWFVYRVA